MRGFRRDRRGAAAVEFALCGGALILMMLAILYLGDLALTLGAMTYAAQVAARAAAVETGANLSGMGAGTGCVAQADIVTLFNGAIPGILPPASGEQGAPSVQASWTDNAGGNGTGAYLRVTATYMWRPPGAPGTLAVAVPLTVTETQMVQGTSGAVATSCGTSS